MMDLRYLLDTNIAAQRLIEVGVAYAGISIVVACEIRFGLAKSGAHRVVNRLTQVLAQCETLSLEPPVDEHYADIRNRLERAGRSIGPNDLLNRRPRPRTGLDAGDRQHGRVFARTGPCGRGLAGGGCRPLVIDEAHRTQSSDFGDNLFEAFPNATRITFTGTPLITEQHGSGHTVKRLGEYIDTYKLMDAVDDGTTLQILYEGRTKDTALRDKHFDTRFDDLFRHNKGVQGLRFPAKLAHPPRQSVA